MVARLNLLPEGDRDRAVKAVDEAVILSDDDPVTNPDARRFDSLHYIDALNLGVKVLDSTAISLCMDNHMPIIVLNLWQDGSIVQAVLGEEVGTLISP